MASTRSVVPVAVLAALVAACSSSPAGESEPATTSVPPVTTLAPVTTLPPATTMPVLDVGAVLDEVRERYPAPGALALVRRDGVGVFGASGFADLDGTAITTDTRFRIASITKPIVSALVLDAVQRGEVALDDVVADLLPGAIRPDPPITVRMLLDHTSGVFDEGNEGDVIADLALLDDEALVAEASELLDTYADDGSGIASDRLIVALAETHPRYDAPVATYHYSNPNYQLAGMVLEAVTGRTLDELLTERLATPLGLERMTIAPPDLASPDLRGYGTSVETAAWSTSPTISSRSGTAGTAASSLTRTT